MFLDVGWYHFKPGAEIQVEDTERLKTLLVLLIVFYVARCQKQKSKEANFVHNQ